MIGFDFIMVKGSPPASTLSKYWEDLGSWKTMNHTTTCNAKGVTEPLASKAGQYIPKKLLEIKAELKTIY